MEERERAQPEAVVADAPKLRDVLDSVRSSLSPSERPPAEAFVRQLLEKAGAEFLGGADIRYVVAMALAAYRFLAVPTVDEPRVRIFDPDLSRERWEAPCSVVETSMRDRPFIVDTVQETLRRCGCTIRRLLHPIFAVERD